MCDVSLDQTLSQSMNKYRAIIKVQENQTSPIFKVEMFLALLLVHLGLVLADTNPRVFCGKPNREVRIVNGVKAERNEYPWQGKVH